jgi:hypothetical protein
MRVLHGGGPPLKCRHAGTTFDHPALDGGGPRARTRKGTQATPSCNHGSERFLRVYQRVLGRVFVDVHLSQAKLVGACTRPPPRAFRLTPGALCWCAVVDVRGRPVERWAVIARIGAGLSRTHSPGLR